MRSLFSQLRNLALAGALMLLIVPSALAADPLSIAPGTSRPFSDGLLADGKALLLIQASGATTNVRHDFGWAGGADPCGDYTLPGNEGQSATGVTPTRTTFSYYLRSVAVRYFNDQGGPVTPDQPPCTAAMRLSNTTAEATGSVPLIFPIGNLVFTRPSAPVTPVRQVVVPGDGISSVRVQVAALREVRPGVQEPAAILLSSDPNVHTHTRRAGADSFIRAKLTRDADSPSMRGRNGDLLSPLGTPATRFSVGDDGTVGIIIQSPEVTGRDDVLVRLRVWSEVGNADSAEDLLIRFLAPGQIAEAMLSLPFENLFGAFSLQSRGADPLEGSLLVADATRVAGVKDFGLGRSDATPLQYDAASSINPEEGTISLWVRPAAASDSWTAPMPLLAAGDLALTLEPNGVIRLRVGGTELTSPARAFGTDRYRHIAASWSSRGMQIALDGRVIARGTTPVTVMLGDDDVVDVGAVGTAFFAGRMDQLHVFASAFRDAQAAFAFEHGQDGALNTNPSMFSTVGFEGGRAGLFGSVRDGREVLRDDCFDPAETSGALSNLCARGLSSRPQAPVRVTQCSDLNVDGERVVVPCTTAGAQHETDALYLADVGTQQFGAARAVTLGYEVGTFEPFIPHPGFNRGPFLQPVRFASPVSTRFRLPPKDIPNLVVCNFPAIAGQRYNLADLEGYIFEDDGTNLYGGTGPLANRFKCVEPIGTDEEQLERLNELRDRYGFVLRDNEDMPLTQGWTFTFKPTGTDDSFFDLRLYQPLTDAADSEDPDMQLMPYRLVPMVTLESPDYPDGIGSATTPVFSVSPISSLFDFALPGVSTRTGAMTVLGPGANADDPRSFGFAQMHGVVIRFAAPGGAGDASTYFETQPFNIRFEIYPGAPTYLPDASRPGGACETDPESADCEAARATELRLWKPIE